MIRSTKVPTSRRLPLRPRVETYRTPGLPQRPQPYCCALVESALGITLVLDPDRKIRYESPAVGVLLGYRPDELVGQDPCEVVHPQDREELESLVGEGLAEPGRASSAELRLRHRDGSWRILQARAVNLIKDPVVQGVIVRLHDVTEKRRLEKTVQMFRERFVHAEKMSVLGRLAGGIVHDLRNWLFVIRAQTNLLADTEVPGLRKPVQEIQRAVDQSEGLMRNLAAFGQREPGGPQVNDLNHVVSHLERTIRCIAGNKVHVVVKTSASSAVVELDREQIQQVLFNLINNSLDAMPKGGTLTIAVYCVEMQPTEVPNGRPSGSYVRLEVEDTGHGMDGTVKAKLFEPFFTTKNKGTGLGLANVREVVDELGGFIKVWSEPSRGSRFEVFVPRISSN